MTYLLVWIGFASGLCVGWGIRNALKELPDPDRLRCDDSAFGRRTVSGGRIVERIEQPNGDLVTMFFPRPVAPFVVRQEDSGSRTLDEPLDDLIGP